MKTNMPLSCYSDTMEDDSASETNSLTTPATSQRYYGSNNHGGSGENLLPSCPGIIGYDDRRSKSSSLDDINGDSVVLSWEGLSVTIRKRQPLFSGKPTQPMKILRNISGIVRSGTLMAVMGSSGSGKTTLLNVLTNRNLGDFDMSGSVKVNGQSLGEKIANISAYVQQDDLFVGVLTVREHLWFQAMLRMDQHLTAKERESRIDDVIRDLGLQKCEHSTIGVPGKLKAISGGERKRLAFASEILTNPRIMFCDEPTSGLDSYMAENVVQTLRTLAGQGKAILCTIHQPSSETFALFDNLMLLAEGRLVYLGSATGARDFFRDTGFPCPQQYNPADFYVHTLALVPSRVDECRIRIKKMANAFRLSENGRQLVASVNEANPSTSSAPNNDHLNNRRRSSAVEEPLVKANYWRQLCCLGWRSATANYRDVIFVRVRLLQNILIALFTGLVFFAQNNDQKGVQNINGCLFLICTNMTFSNAFGVILTYTAEMPLFIREHQNGTYRTSVYYICKMLADLPLFIINPIVFTAITYWMVGMKPDFWSFFICSAATVLMTNTVVSWGYLISAACGEGNTATVVTGPFTMPFILFGGFLLNDASIPIYFIWLQYLSWFRYTNEIFVVNQWHDFGEIECEYNQNVTSSYFSNVTATVTSSRCFRNGEDVVASYNFHPENVKRDFVLLAVLLVAFRIVGFVFLWLRANPIRLRRQKSINNNNNNNNISSPRYSNMLNESDDNNNSNC